MELSIVDRIVIFFGMLPPTGTLNEIMMQRHLKELLKLSPEEEAMGVVFDKDQNGSVYLKYLSQQAADYTSNIDLSDMEIAYLKKCAEAIDKQGTASDFNADTLIKFLTFELEPKKQEQGQ